MKELKILYLYSDILEMYGDHGNLDILKYRLKQRNFDAIIENCSIGDNVPEFSNYDLIFACGGSEQDQKTLSENLLQHKDNIKKAIDSGVFFLLIGGAYQLFGRYYKNTAGDIIPGLEIFDYYTEATPDRKQGCIGNIIIDVNLNGTSTKVIGFENHEGQTFNVSTPFGKVIFGHGNKFKSAKENISETETNSKTNSESNSEKAETKYEGFSTKNVIATYLHGPLLSKNPELSDYIIKYCLDRKYNENIQLAPLDDTFENKCRENLI